MLEALPGRVSKKSRKLNNRTENQVKLDFSFLRVLEDSIVKKAHRAVI